MPKPRILAITSNLTYLRQIRLEMPLLNLKKQGLIESYFIADSLLTNVPDDYRFDVVWLQKIEFSKLIEHLAEKIDSCYLYDIDDLLPARPSYVRVAPKRGPGAVNAMKNCRVLTVTSHRSLALLEQYTKTALAEKTVICPNGFEFSEEVRSPVRPRGMLWVSGDYMALMQSKMAVLNAVERFARETGLPLYCFGYAGGIKDRVPNMIDLNAVPFWHFKSLLSSFPPLIGIAPLETHADKEDLDFINAKSDIKMIDFGGSGHPAVYSLAPPYADTDLKCGVLSENSEKAWLDSLDLVYREHWKRLDQEQAAIIEARRMDRIAAECWYEAIERVRFNRPMSGRKIKFPLVNLLMKADFRKFIDLLRKHL